MDEETSLDSAVHLYFDASIGVKSKQSVRILHAISLGLLWRICLSCISII